MLLAVPRKVRIFEGEKPETAATMEKGYPVKYFGQPVRRFCQTLDLKDDPALIERYRRVHSREESWPEIRAGIRQVGILEMEVYILGSRLFMIVEAPLDFDWDSAMARLASLPRQQEWEDFVALFQASRPGASSAEKWQMMERMFYLYD